MVEVDEVVGWDVDVERVGLVGCDVDGLSSGVGVEMGELVS
jgi:hypothetical protein